MSTELRDRLERLAERAPAARPDGPDLWRAGKRRQVRRTAASAATVLVFALVAGVGAAALMPRIMQPAPAGTGAELRLPDTVYPPGIWLSGTDEAGPIGPLVAILGADRRGFWKTPIRNNVVGISVDGTYRFLELPGADPLLGTDPSLSPDGRWVAYFYQGTPSGDPNTSDPSGLAFTGVAAYDTVTGEVVKHPVATEHGLRPRTIAWSGGFLITESWQFTSGGDDGGGTFGGQLTWNPLTDEARIDSDFDNSLSVDSSGPAPGGLVGHAGSGRKRLLVTLGQDVTHVLRTDLYVEDPSISPDGGLIVSTYDRTRGSGGGKPLPLVVGSLPPDDGTGQVEVTLHDVGFTAQEVLGWRDATHAVVMKYSAEQMAAYSVDTATGEAEVLTVFRQESYSPQVQIASDAWSAPVTHATEPDWPMDPRLLAVLSGVGAGLVAAAVLWWRRRRVGP